MEIRLKLLWFNPAVNTEIRLVYFFLGISPYPFPHMKSCKVEPKKTPQEQMILFTNPDVRYEAERFWPRNVLPKSVSSLKADEAKTDQKGGESDLRQDDNT